MPRKFTREEVLRNNTKESLWCIIDGRVYDLTEFLESHPGGEFVLLQAGGKDATIDFYNLHRQSVLEKYSDLCIGGIENEEPQVIRHNPGDLSVVPYAEPAWLTPQFKSPYYNESHRQLQKAMRVFTETYILPEAQEKEVSGEKISQALIQRMADANILGMRVGPGKHLHGRSILNGVLKGEDFNYFHDLVVTQELVRATARGFWDGNMVGMTISLTAVLQHANPVLKEEVQRDCLSGKKTICLAVSEAFAGSDVSNIRTVAEKTPDGQFYIVNGTKKWITNGTWCDYFVTGVKTGDGLSVLLIERSKGVETKAIKTSYSAAAGTAFVTFDNVKVPVRNLLGQEGKGLKVILSNFNHERWMVTCAGVRMSRIVVEECLKWSNQRQVFGKRLVDQPVIRAKLAKMISLVEAMQAWLEHTTFQMTQMSHSQQSEHLAGPIGLLKMYASRCAHEIAENAVHIFGGRALTRTGMGNVVEMFHRTTEFDAILGGSEDIIGDMAVRQAVKKFPKSML
ncbi:acyl-CoA dehydrogenase-like protein [Lepidopterella palustris CBS 459.81]|uniref:Acyl-CoA dehydrogenase-like protein n=1 Tax=Lepidopterella palustris CBS 459.81 TaxID=1314670 RepID=A0A8E2E6L6_9PEZI|nr:acyl-CoA dehydrogenase-like protein [Lepidopterella palustris CBS 459.81]